MVAAREVFFASLVEIGLFVILILLHRKGGGLSLAGWFAGPQAISLAGTQGALLLLVIVALFLLLLAENSRVPVDDPATHLELTMIHEVMILDHSGPDLALIEFGAHCRLLFSACLVASLLRPTLAAGPLTNGLVFVGLLVLVYAAVGVTESITARLRMNLVPKFILTSFALVFFAIILTMELV